MVSVPRLVMFAAYYTARQADINEVRMRRFAPGAPVFPFCNSDHPRSRAAAMYLVVADAQVPRRSLRYRG